MTTQERSKAAGLKLEQASLVLIAAKAEHAAVTRLVFAEQCGFDRMTLATESLNHAQYQADMASRRFVAALKDQYRS